MNAFPAILSLFALLFLCQCAKPRSQIFISVPEQQLALINQDGQVVRRYPVSTSKFGLGDQRGSNKTPLGKFVIQQKIGGGAPSGMVFKSRRPTGEILPPNAPGRDPIVTRILWLRGLESQNKGAYSRYIYIHGTPEESKIGRPASYGCIRMKSRDVIDLYNNVAAGTLVNISLSRIPSRGSSR